MLVDPYLNTDAGTMSPFEHGEGFVLDDGGEVRKNLLPSFVLCELTVSFSIKLLFNLVILVCFLA